MTWLAPEIDATVYPGLGRNSDGHTLDGQNGE
jgi:hypothetical protein